MLMSKIFIHSFIVVVVVVVVVMYTCTRALASESWTEGGTGSRLVVDRDRTRSVGDLSWLGSTADSAAADVADDSDAVNARCSRRDTTTDRHFHESHHLDTRYRRPAAATRCSAKPNVSPPGCATSRLHPANRFHFSPHANTIL